MSKKTDKNPSLTAPNYEALTTVEEVDAEIDRRKNVLVNKDRTEYQIKENKREFVSATNEQLRELKEEREHEIVVIGALEDHKRQLLAGAGIIALRP